MEELIYLVKSRWRIERDYQEMRDELGLDRYEGRNWRSFHHHGVLCIAAYAFLAAERARLSPSTCCLLAPRYLTCGVQGAGGCRCAPSVTTRRPSPPNGFARRACGCCDSPAARGAGASPAPAKPTVYDTVVLDCTASASPLGPYRRRRFRHL